MFLFVIFSLSCVDSDVHVAAYQAVRIITCHVIILFLITVLINSNININSHTGSSVIIFDTAIVFVIVLTT